mgnify:CR=1 FL=1
MTDIYSNNYYLRASFKGMVRFLHAADPTVNVDIYMNEQLVIKKMNGKQITPYVPIKNEIVQFDIYLCGEAQPIIRKEINVKRGTTYTLVLFGTANDLQIKFLAEELDIPHGESKVRFIHVAKKWPNLDIAVKNLDTIFSNIGYSEHTPYLTLSPMMVQLEARKANTKTVIFPMNHLSFYPNQLYSIYIVSYDSKPYWVVHG